jgi:DNA-binding response OmpR family regulator
MDDYVAKPLNPERLFAIIDRLCGDRRVDQAQTN